MHFLFAKFAILLDQRAQKMSLGSSVGKMNFGLVLIQGQNLGQRVFIMNGVPS